MGDPVTRRPFPDPPWYRSLGVVRGSLIGQLPADHRSAEGSIHRRRFVVAIFGVIGAAVLGLGLRTQPGTGGFYASTFALAAVWALGGVLGGPIRLGWTLYDGHLRRPVIAPIIVGAALTGLFVAGAFVVRHIAPLADRVEGVLDYARHGSFPAVLTVTVTNGVAEEVFFRGAVQPALPCRVRLPGTVMIYALVTMTSGNIMLGLASVLLGTVVSLQRRSTDGVLAPVLTHVTWSVSMLVILPLVFR